MSELQRELYEETHFGMRRLTEKERLKIMADFCPGCGIYLVDEDGNREQCNCLNDE